MIKDHRVLLNIDPMWLYSDPQKRDKFVRFANNGETEPLLVQLGWEEVMNWRRYK